MSERSFFDRLAAYGPAPALVEDGAPLSYADVAARAQAFADGLGGRRLVFLEAANTSASICAYLGCLIAHSPVYLFSPQDHAFVEGLRARYRPHVVVRNHGAQVEVERLHDDEMTLHPDLRVLLSTSGSTGSPKLVKLSEANIQSNADSIVEYLRLDDSERAITALKYNYSFGMSVVHSHLNCGAALILTDMSVVDDGFWDLFRESGATSLSGVPYTFETLQRLNSAAFQTSSLRYMAQAGGRLAPEAVRHFARLGEEGGWRFYVMYGQTEAAPRMAYLPPEAAQAHPDCIGTAVPGGELFLVDEDGRRVEDPAAQGQLAYAGPNVMMGYAQTPEELATAEDIPYLLTGDIAGRNAAGLFYIAGRSSRFVKPYGVRVNLDDVQAHVREVAPEALCVGASETIVVLNPDPASAVALEARLNDAAVDFKLPRFVFRALQVEAVPRLPSGKPDLVAAAALARAAAEGDAQGPSRRGETAVPDVGTALRIVFSTAFVKAWWNEALQMVGARSRDWGGVADIFKITLSEGAVSPDDTFTGLAGDSLSYVQTSLAIEEYLGHLPADWEHMTVGELEGTKREPTAI